MHYKISTLVIFTLAMNHCLSQDYMNCSRDRTACLNYRGSVKHCSALWDCDYIFVCPLKNETMCLHRNSTTCPDINDLTLEELEYYPPRTLTPTSGEEICSYKMKELLRIGKPVPSLTLSFDRYKGELALFTDIDKKYIRCFTSAYSFGGGFAKVNFTADGSSRYPIKIDDVPNSYFCVASAPFEFLRTRTEDVVAYSDTSSVGYIAKMTLLNVEILTRELNVGDHTLPLKSWKVMKRNQDDEYYNVFFHLEDSDVDKIQNFLDTFVSNYSESIQYLRNIDYCLPNVMTINGMNLHWNTTAIGTWTTPYELCLDNNGIPVTRRCVGDFFTGAVWSEPSGVCSDAIEIPDKTSKLYELTRMENITEVFTDIIAVTDDFTEFTPMDVNLLADGLKTISNIKNVSALEDDFLMGISNAMRINSTILKESQQQLNSTDKILGSIENFVMNIAEDITNSSTTIQSNVLTHITCPFMTNRIGLALYRNGNDFRQYKILDIKFDQTFEDLPLENLDLAVYVPSDFIRKVTNNLTAEEREKFKIINTVFYNDGLFNDVSNKNRSAGSRIIEVKIPGFASNITNIEAPINILFRPILNFTNPNCAFWYYGHRKLGEWSTVGGKSLGSYRNETLLQCTFNHITHFALLVLSGNIIKTRNEMRIDPLEPHKETLSVMTLIGCGLSFIGILIMLLCALVFKGWHKKRLNTIQLAILMLLEIIVLFVADLDSLKGGTACTAIGASLHYIVLAKFFRMLIIARLQYFKFVEILENLKIKSNATIYMTIGWILPVIPVALAVLIFPDSYKSGNLNFCYAHDYTLYYFLIIPACVIILINIGLFLLIMVTISGSKAKDYGRGLLRIQINLGVMLFFMLGITWIFGILAQFLPFHWTALILIYLFCMLAPLQGFVLFVFNVILDKATMELCRDLFKITPYEKSTRSEVLHTSQSGNVTVNYSWKRD